MGAYRDMVNSFSEERKKQNRSSASILAKTRQQAEAVTDWQREDMQMRRDNLYSKLRDRASALSPSSTSVADRRAALDRDRYSTNVRNRYADQNDSEYRRLLRSVNSQDAYLSMYRKQMEDLLNKYTNGKKEDGVFFKNQTGAAKYAQALKNYQSTYEKYVNAVDAYNAYVGGPIQGIEGISYGSPLVVTDDDREMIRSAVDFTTPWMRMYDSQSSNRNVIPNVDTTTAHLGGYDTEDFAEISKGISNADQMAIGGTADDAIEKFRDVEREYQRLLRKGELEDKDKTSAQNMLNKLATMSGDTSTPTGQMAAQYTDLFTRLLNGGSYLGYAASQFGSGLASVYDNSASGLNIALEMIKNGGDDTAAGFNKLEQYLSNNPDRQTSLGLGIDTNADIKALSGETGVKESTVRAYANALRNDALRQKSEEGFGSGLDRDSKEWIGRTAYSVGQQLPILLSGTAGVPKSIESIVKRAFVGTPGTWLMGLNVAGGTLGQQMRSGSDAVTSIVQSVGNGMIEMFTEGLGGLTGLDDLDRMMPSPTGSYTRSVLRGLLTYTATGASEALEEVINVPLSGLLSKYGLFGFGADDKDKKLVGTGGVFDLKAMLESGIDGGTVGLILGGLGGVASVANALQTSGNIKDAAKRLNAIVENTQGIIDIKERLTPAKATQKDVDEYIVKITEELYTAVEDFNVAESAGQNVRKFGMEDELLNTALTEDEKSEAYKTASEIQQIMKEKHYVTDERVGRLYMATAKTFAEKQIAPATTEERTEISKDIKSAENREAYIASLKEADQDEVEFKTQFKQLYDMAAIGVPEKSVYSSILGDSLTRHQKEVAYILGEADKKTTASANVRTQLTAGQKKTSGVVRTEGVKFSELRKGFNKNQNIAYNLFSSIAQATGIDIVLYRSTVNEDGTITDPQGKYSRSTPGTIYIDVNSGVMNNGNIEDAAQYTMVKTFTHEFTHFIENWNADLYAELRDVVFARMNESGKDVASVINNMIAQDKSLTFDLAAREVVAEGMVDILPESAFISDLAQNHKSLFDQVFGKLRDFVKRLRAYFDSLGNTTPEARALKHVVEGELKYWDDVVKAFDKAAKGAVENYQAARNSESTAAEDVSVTAAEEVQKQSRRGFSAQEEITREYQKNADKIFANTYKGGKFLLLGYTPEIYAKLGMPELPFLIGKGHVYSIAKTKTEAQTDNRYSRGIHYHGLGEDTVKNIYEAIQDPVMIIAAKDTETKTTPMRSTHSVVAIVDVGTNGESLLVPISVTADRAYNGVHIDANVLSSAYKRDVSALIREAIALENINKTGVYYIKKEAEPLIGVGVQFPIRLQDAATSNGIVRPFAQNVNMVIQDKTQSKQFAKWFGDWQNKPEKASKVVNADGTPKIMYRGDPVEFWKFDKKKAKYSGLYGRGFYFSDSESHARQYGEARGFYLNIRRPVPTTETTISKKQMRKFLEAVKQNEDDYSFENYGYDATVNSVLNSVYGKSDFAMLYDVSQTAIGDMVETVKLFNQVNNTKFDGLILDTETVVFEPNQIKSATDNIGLYSKHDDDTRYQRRRTDLTPEELKDFEQRRADEIYLSGQIEQGKKMAAQARKDREEADARLRKLQNELINARLDAKAKAEQAELVGRIEQGKKMAAQMRRQEEAYEQRLERLANLLDEVRERRDVKLEETRQKLRDYKAQRRDTQSRRVLRERIIKRVKELDQLTRNWSDQKHIPDELKPAIIEMVDVFTGDTSVFSKSNLEGIKKAYETLKKKENESNLSDLYDEEILDKLSTLAEIKENRRLSELSAEELSDMLDIVDHFRFLVKEGNEIFVNGRKQTVDEAANKVFEDAKARGNKRYYAALDNMLGRMLTTGNVTPFYFFKHIGGEMQDLFNNFVEGQTKWARHMQEAQKFFEEIEEKYHYFDWSERNTNRKHRKKKLEFTTENGDSVKLTVEEALGLYATWKREHSDNLQQAGHLEQGGFTYQDEVKVEGKKGKPGYTVEEGYGRKLTANDMQIINSFLTDEQKAYADAVVEYMSKEMAALGNETSKALHGYSKFGEEYYYPYQTSKLYIKNNLEAPEGQARIKNISFSKKTKQFANTPIVARDFTEVATEHIVSMIHYNAMAKAQDDFMRVFNYKAAKDSESAGKTVQTQITAAYGKEALQYMETLMRDIYGGTRTDPGSKVFEKATSRFKKNAVFASASVVLQQPSAMGRAMAIIDPKYFANISTPMVNLFTKKNWEEAKKYSGTAVIKEMGRFDINTGVASADWIVGKQYTDEDVLKSVGKKAMALIKDADYRDNVLGFATAKADQITWGYIWDAVKKETKAKTGLSGEALLQATGKRFDEVINYTQVYDSVLTRSENMRSKTSAMQAATAFMAESTVTINMLADAMFHTKGIKGKLRTVGAVVFSIVLNTALKSIVSAARDDEDENTYAEKYIAAFVGNLIGEPMRNVPYIGNYLYLSGDLNPLTMVPYVKDIISVFQGYDVERTDISLFADLADAVADIDGDSKTKVKKFQALSGAIGAMFGVPVRNVWRDVQSVINVIHSKKIGETSAAGIRFAVREELGMISGRTGYYNYMLDAIDDGESEKFDEAYDYVAERMLSDGKDAEEADKAISTGIRKELRKRFENGDVDADEAQDIMIEHLGMDADDAYFKVDEWAYKNDSDDEDVSYSKFIRLYDAVDSGKNVDAEIKKLKNIGYSNDDIRSEIRTHVRDLYVGDEDSEPVINKQEAISMLKKYGDLNDEEAKDRVQEWTMILDTGSSYDNIKSAYLDGEITANTAISQRMKYGGYTREEAEEEVKINWACEKKYGITPGQLKQAYIDGDVNRSTATRILRDYKDLEETEVKSKLDWYDFVKSYPDYEDITEAAVRNYNTYCKNSGISASTFYEANAVLKDLTGDEDENGDSIPYSKVKKIVTEIDKLNLSANQKTQLAKCYIKKETTIKKYKKW